MVAKDAHSCIMVILDNETETVMEVYFVIGGFDYEGEQADSLRLFVEGADAYAYRDELLRLRHFDYVELATRRVE